MAAPGRRLGAVVRIVAALRAVQVGRAPYVAQAYPAQEREVRRHLQLDVDR